MSAYAESSELKLSSAFKNHVGEDKSSSNSIGEIGLPGEMSLGANPNFPNNGKSLGSSFLLTGPTALISLLCPLPY